MKIIGRNIALNNRWDDDDTLGMTRMVAFCNHPLFNDISMESKSKLLYMYGGLYPPEVRVFFSVYVEAQFIKHDDDDDDDNDDDNDDDDEKPKKFQPLKDFDYSMQHTFAIDAHAATFVMTRCIETQNFGYMEEMMTNMCALYIANSPFRDIVHGFISNHHNHEDNHQLIRLLDKHVMKFSHSGKGSSLPVFVLQLLFRNLFLLPTLLDRDEVIGILGKVISSSMQMINPMDIINIIKSLGRFQLSQRMDMHARMQRAGLFMVNYGYMEMILILDAMVMIESHEERLRILDAVGGNFKIEPEEMVSAINFLMSVPEEKRCRILPRVHELVTFVSGRGADINSNSRSSISLRNEHFYPLFKLFEKWIFTDHDMVGFARIQIVYAKVFCFPKRMTMGDALYLFTKVDTVATKKYPTVYELNGFLTIVMEWTHQGMSSKEIGDLIETFGEKIHDMDLLCKHFVPQLKELVAPPFCFASDGIVLITNLSAIFYFEEQTQIVQLIRALADEMGFMSTPKLSSLVKGLHKTPSNERDCIMRIVAQCSRYIRNSTYHILGIDDVCIIIETLRMVNVWDREPLFVALRPFLDPHMTSSTDIAVVMTALRLIPSNYLDRFSELALSFIVRPRMNGYEMTSIINALHAKMINVLGSLNEKTLNLQQRFLIVDDELSQVVRLTNLFLKDCRYLAVTGHTVAAIMESIHMIDSVEDREYIVAEVVHSTLCPLLQV